jgi:hypothetical protein
MKSKQLYSQYKGLRGAKTPQARAQRRSLVSQIAAARRAERGVGKFAEPVNPMAPGKFAKPLRPPPSPQVPNIGARPSVVPQPPISVTGPIDLTKLRPAPNLNQDKYGAGMMPPRTSDYPTVPSPRSEDYPIAINDLMNRGQILTGEKPMNRGQILTGEKPMVPNQDPASLRRQEAEYENQRRMALEAFMRRMAGQVYPR